MMNTMKFVVDNQEKMQRPESEEQYKRRQHFGETAFAVMKACFDMRRFSAAGIEGFEPNFSGLALPSI